MAHLEPQLPLLLLPPQLLPRFQLLHDFYK